MENTQDVSLLIDGQVFNVKKEMLCEYSDYFRAMFSGNYIEKEQQEVSIDVVDAESMIIILRYMEIGLIDLSEHSLSTIGDLALAASFLQITELMKQIEYYLEQQLSLSNWIKIMEIAQNGSYTKLEEYSAAYGIFSFDVMKPDYIPNIQKLFWYLSHPYLNTKCELQVFIFGFQWITFKELGADALLVILCCLDMTRLTREELKEIKDLIKHNVNSLAEKIVDCLCKISVDFELSETSIRQEKKVLCELYTEKVYTEVLNLFKESITRKLKLTPIISLWRFKDSKPEMSPNYMSTFTKENGFQQWLEVAEKNLWGWNITSWGLTKLVVVCGEYGRGTGVFMKDVKVYDILKKEWIHHGVKLPSRRHGGIAVIEDTLFIVGGVGAFRVVLDTAIIYDLKQRTYRKIANFPDATQCPAVCTHENVLYAAGYVNIYKYEDCGDHDRWTAVLNTDIRPNRLVSFKGYIYVMQSYFNNMYRFMPNVDTKLELIFCFHVSPAGACNLGDKMLIFTNTNSTLYSIMAVEEYKGVHPEGMPKIIWSEPETEYNLSEVADTLSVVMTMPPINLAVSSYHKRYLMPYDEAFSTN